MSYSSIAQPAMVNLWSTKFTVAWRWMTNATSADSNAA